MDPKKLRKNKIEMLEGVLFWLAVLRKADGFTNLQKEKLNLAYHEVNDVSESLEEAKVLDKLVKGD